MYLYKKPKTILYAEYALLAWTVWTCLFGMYQTWVSIPEFEKMLDEQLQGIVIIDASRVMQMALGVYALVAVTSIWIIFRIDAGKNWARASVLIGFILDFLWCAAPPHHGLIELVSDIPDLGLQIYALYLLYTWPGERWFNRSLPT